MKKKYNQVYQFKITLKGIKPPIWRRIQVPETYTFWDLHVAIQDAMGWIDYHLHEFELENPSTGLTVNIGSPNEDFGEEVLPDGGQKIADYFSMENRAADYVYDFGDNWEHKIQLKIQELLGHKSSKTTEIYTHVSNKDLSQIKSPLDRLFENRKGGGIKG